MFGPEDLKTGCDFFPRFDDVWRYFWLSRVGGGKIAVGILVGRWLNTLQRIGQLPPQRISWSVSHPEVEKCCCK